MRPRVFAVQQPTGRDRESGLIYPTMDLTPAEDWGKLQFILREFENPFDDIDATAGRVRDALKEDGFTASDWLLLVGNPVLIATVAAIAAELVGELNVLQWNRTNKAYAPVRLRLQA